MLYQTCSVQANETSKRKDNPMMNSQQIASEHGTSRQIAPQEQQPTTYLGQPTPSGYHYWLRMPHDASCSPWVIARSGADKHSSYLSNVLAADALRFWEERPECAGIASRLSAALEAACITRH